MWNYRETAVHWPLLTFLIPHSNSHSALQIPSDDSGCLDSYIP